jgi:hypothetical protein
VPCCPTWKDSPPMSRISYYLLPSDHHILDVSKIHNSVGPKTDLCSLPQVIHRPVFILILEPTLFVQVIFYGLISDSFLSITFQIPSLLPWLESFLNSFLFCPLFFNLPPLKPSYQDLLLKPSQKLPNESTCICCCFLTLHSLESSQF